MTTSGFIDAGFVAIAMASLAFVFYFSLTTNAFKTENRPLKRYLITAAAAYISIFIWAPAGLFILGLLMALLSALASGSADPCILRLPVKPALLALSAANLFFGVLLARRWAGALSGRLMSLNRRLAKKSLVLVLSVVALSVGGAAWRGHPYADHGAGLMAKMTWLLGHGDDVLYATMFAGWGHVFGWDRQGLEDFQRLARGQAPPGAKVARADAAKKYVVFSDLHLLEKGARHDHFKNWSRAGHGPGNHEIFHRALDYYQKHEFYLVEAGDIEDLFVKAPGFGRMAKEQIFDAVLGPLGNYFDGAAEKKERLQKLRAIARNYASHYEHLRDSFFKHGRLIKLIGNHDEALLEPEFLNVLREIYGGPIEVYEYLALVDDPAVSNSPVRAVVAHGHQFDVICAIGAGDLIGEVYTESLAWFGTGADRVWPGYSAQEGGWTQRMRRDSGFANTISRSPSFFKEKNAVVKWRHMNEDMAAKAVTGAGPEAPYLVLGHTHEPRFRAADKNGSLVEKYVNTGSASLYEQLVWAVEIINGRPALVAWRTNEQGALIKTLMEATPDGRLIPAQDKILAVASPGGNL
ncbi:MAG: hypothetical protein HYT79_07010 [Elusimicrobia bacterium]|nr:hypothetical protein [Elusimicrobiota bacterium]